MPEPADAWCTKVPHARRGDQGGPSCRRAAPPRGEDALGRQLGAGAAGGGAGRPPRARADAVHVGPGAGACQQPPGLQVTPDGLDQGGLKTRGAEQATAAELLAARPELVRLVGVVLEREIRQARRLGARVPPGACELADACLAGAQAPPEQVSPPKPRAGAAAESLSIEQVAQTLGCSVQYARRLARKGADQGGIKAARVGVTWVVAATDLDEWI